MSPDASPEIPPYQNPDLPFEQRAADLVARMTLEEKIAQMVYTAPAIERLGVPAYNWWNECLHGVGRAGIATVFPQAIGMAATWNEPLIHATASAIADEGRAKHHQALREGRPGDQYEGLTFWTPNINIFRDPRWGRGQETYGECPFLAARLGVAFVRGLQGNDPTYLKAVATPKHFAVHSGPEHDRHHFDVDVSDRDLYMTYLPHFRATVQEGGAVSVMTAYQRFRGQACSASEFLMQTVLREDWGFTGYIVSDCGAISDIYQHHRIVETAAEAAALAVAAGCDLNCGQTYPALVDAVAQGLIDETAIDRAVTRLMLARFRLGMFDPPERVPFAQTPYTVTDAPAHRALALHVARESLVLLKNDGLLPLDKSQVRTVAVIGPNADSVQVLHGNYHGIAAQPVTPLAALRALLEPEVEVLYTPGSHITQLIRDDEGRARNESLVAAADLARRADVALVFLGLSQALEGEEGQHEGVEAGRSQGDRADLVLPAPQQQLLETVHATGTPVVLVLMNGSALAVNWATDHVPAILEAWYPGQAGGTAIAEALFGLYNPGGRLPVTFYKSVEQLPPFTDYTMPAHNDLPGRTYRYFAGDPLYAFGHGLSYTQFAYGDLSVEPATMTAGEPVTVGVTVRNVGQRAGDEVVQLYLTDAEASVPVPLRQLSGFARIHLAAGAEQRVTFTLTPAQMAVYTDDGQQVVEPGEFAISVGGKQPGSGGGADAPTTAVVRGAFTVTGAPYTLD